MAGRAVTLEKAAGARLGMGLCQHQKNVVGVSTVADDSPLAGVVFPGDILLSLDGKPQTSAAKLATKLVEASWLRLQVITPLASVAMFFHAGSLNVELGRCKTTGLPRVLSADVERADGCEPRLHPGDLILALGSPHDGAVHSVAHESPKAVQKRLREAQSAGAGALVEMRVVRHPESAAEAGAPPTRSPPKVTRCVARDAVRRVERSSSPPTGTTGTESGSGRSSPTNSFSPSSDSDSDGAARPSAEGAAWRSRIEHHRRASHRAETSKAYAVDEGKRGRMWPREPEGAMLQVVV